MGHRLSQIRLLQFPGKCRRHQPLPHHEHGLKSHRTGNLLCGLQLGTPRCLELDAFHRRPYVPLYRRYLRQLPLLYGHFPIPAGTLMPVRPLLLQRHGHADRRHVQPGQCCHRKALHRRRIPDAVFFVVPFRRAAYAWRGHPETKTPDEGTSPEQAADPH